MSVWFPIGSDHIAGLGVDGQYHAVETMSTVARPAFLKDGKTRRKPPRPSRWTVVCGARVIGMVAGEAADEHGEPTGDAIVNVWPPPARGQEHPRCKQCHLATGRKRPQIGWRPLEEQLAAR